jgi:hypothetical protein
LTSSTPQRPTESTAAFGWAVGHSEVAVLDRALDRAGSGDDSWAMGILTHATFADPEAGIGLLERLLESPDVVEDLLFVGCLDAPFEQDFPDFPQYWEPETELDYQVEISDGERERLLAVIGRSIPAVCDTSTTPTGSIWNALQTSTAPRTTHDGLRNARS